ncbi:DUF3310 domain-containing protein [Streptomyces sp. NPDC006261]|uniref:DUF3310 domain-containing protein n=1 Tax=Streptomyces sp. NPDC006261 TaxID=3156739 RepID=UPI0033A97E96
MSNFEVGDRVVVVKNNHPGQTFNSYLFNRGKVTHVAKAHEYEVTVELDDKCVGTFRCFDSSELELECVYDALSAPLVEEKSSEESSFFDSKVDMTDEFGDCPGFPECPREGICPGCAPVLIEEDVINHPSHYADGWSNGAEVIDIVENLNFNRGNAVKYLSRAGKKGGPEKELEDLQKALWYVTREVQRLGGTP